MNNPTVKSGVQLGRQLASLKVLSRLLGHELHTQTTAKTITLSREEVLEMQTTLDLFIEEAARHFGAALAEPGQTRSVGETHLVPTRN